MVISKIAKNKIKVAILFGGRSGEHEVSLDSARSVIDNIHQDKYEYFQVGITHEGRWLTGEDVLHKFRTGILTGLEPAVIFPDPSKNGLYVLRNQRYIKLTELDVVFPVLHGTYGEDGTIQGVLEMADLAYVGAGVTGSAVGMDKAIFKSVMSAKGIPVVESILVLKHELEEIEKVIRRAEKFTPYPLFIKPVNQGSSVGISKVFNRLDLYEGLRAAADYDNRILIERGVDAREIEISVLGNQNPKVSVAGEILPSREYYSYESKYMDGTSKLIIPAPLPDTLTKKIRILAKEAFIAADCSGMARVDFFIEKNSGKLIVNEINTIPGFTNISMYPKLWEASGMNFSQLIDQLIVLALERKLNRDRIKHTFRSTI